MAEKQTTNNRKTRYALEWFMRAQDAWYWRRGVRRMNKITALAATGTAIAIAALIVAIIGR